MEGWSNQELLKWVASIGFGVWTPYLQDEKLTGDVFSTLTVEGLEKYQLDHFAAKRIVLKREKFFNNSGGSKGGRLRRLTSHLSLRKEKKKYDEAGTTRISKDGALSDPESNPDHESEENGSPSCNNQTDTSTCISTPLSPSAEQVPDIVIEKPVLPEKPILLEKKALSPAIAIHHSHSHSASALLPVKRSKSPGKRRGVVSEVQHSSMKTSGGVEETKDGRKVNVVGTPFNITHTVHVEFNAELGFIGLPGEWKTFLEENAAMGLNSRKRDRLHGVKIMRSHRYSTGKKTSILQWDLKNVKEWLDAIGFSIYKEQFERFNCNGTKLFTLMKEDLESMGITSEKNIDAILKQVLILKTPAKSYHTNETKLRRRSKSIDTVHLEEFSDSENEAYDREPTIVYGVPLDALLERQRSKYPHLRVPVLIDKVITYIKQKGLKEHGIFRISPSLSKIKDLRDRIDRGEDVALDDILDCHLVAALLKQFLRELPDPIIPQPIYTLCVCALHKDINIIRDALKQIPESNYAFLYEVMVLLQLIVQNQADNLMNAENLSRVFGPTLLWQNTIFDGMLDPLGPIQQANELVLTFIVCYSTLFTPPSPPAAALPTKPDLIAISRQPSKDMSDALRLDLPAALNKRLIVDVPLENGSGSRTAPCTPTSEAIPIPKFASKLELPSQTRPFSYTVSHKAPSSPTGEPPMRPFAASAPASTERELVISPPLQPRPTSPVPVTDSPPKKITRKQTPGRLSADVPKSPPMATYDHVDSPQISSSAPTHRLNGRKLTGVLPPLLVSQDPHKAPVLLAPSASVHISSDDESTSTSDKKIFRRSRSVGSMPADPADPNSPPSVNPTTTPAAAAPVISPRSEKKSFRLRFLRK